MLSYADQFLAVLMQKLFELAVKSSTGIVIELGSQRGICLFHAGEIERLHTDRIMFLAELVRLLILPVAALLHDMTFQLGGTLFLFVPTATTRTKPSSCMMIPAKLVLRQFAITGITSVFSGVGDIETVLRVVQTDYLFIAHRLRLCDRDKNRQHQIDTVFCTIAIDQVIFA